MSADGCIVVVGGTEGIGKELARHYANAGRETVLTGRDASRAEAVAAEIGGAARGIALDLAKPKMAIIEDALTRFYADCSRYPLDSEGLDALLFDPGNTTGWNGPYIKQSQLLDPWGNLYIYVAQGTINPGGFDLISLGADGQEGGEGENQDFYND